jgi:hypothetical protein
MGFVLQFPKLSQVIDAISNGLDVSVEHGASALAAELMPRAVNIQILCGTSFVKISAPPPVSELSPASFSSISVSRTDFLASHAKWRISMAVKHFNCKRESSDLRAFKNPV